MRSGRHHLDRRRASVGLGICLMIALILPAVARAGGAPIPNVNWNGLLPPTPGVPASADPATPCGINAPPSCVDHDIKRLIANWEQFDASCDPRAVIALIDLRATQKFRTFLSDRRGSAFYENQRRYINLDRALQNGFLDAFASYEKGTAPPAWKIAFDAALGHHTNAVQDALLGMNAFLQRNMPVALAAIGVGGPGAASFKSDYNHHNDVFFAAFPSVEDELGRRYDPLFNLDSTHALGEIGGLETLRAWREGAWRNAELLDSAKTPEERTSVMASIDASSEAWARMIVAPDFSSWWTVRYAHCKAFQSSLAQGKAG